MKNVLFIHSSSELYGSDRSLLNIVKNINKDRFSITVILPSYGPLVEELKKVASVDIIIYEVAVLRRKNLSFFGLLKYFTSFFNSILFVKKIIREKKIDIVDTNTAVVFPAAIAAKMCRVRSIWHIREIIKSQFENQIISFMMDNFADIIVANSISTGRALKVNQDKVRVVYNAVDEKEAISQRVQNKSFVVGMAGRINRWKGQRLFIEAAEIVINNYPDTIFKIAGDAYAGEEYLKSDLEKYIYENKLEKNVILEGQVNDMDSFYNQLDLFVLPSIQPEPFGLVVIEAMEFGIPVIATNHGGPTEIIRDGIDGYLVDYNHPNEMATRIMEFISNRNEKIKFGENGKRRKRELFSVDAMVKKVESIFDEEF
nr:glycosyltransferase family 4 protein [Streptococcus lutetiensis]